VIVPDEVQTIPQGYKIIVLDKSGRWDLHALPRGKDLNGVKGRESPSSLSYPE